MSDFEVARWECPECAGLAGSVSVLNACWPLASDKDARLTQAALLV